MSQDPTDRDRLTRRSVVRAGVWTVPVVAVAEASPAYAASPCAPVTLSYGAAGSTFTSGTAGGVVVGVSSSGADGATNNKTVGNLSGATNALRFYSPVANNTSQTLVLTFDRPVANLKFTLLDIDSTRATTANVVTTQYFDSVTITPTGYTPTIVNTANVQGNGTTTPFTATGPNVGADDAGTTGNVAIEYPLASSVTQVTIVYSQVGTVVGNVAPHVGISTLTYRAIIC